MPQTEFTSGRSDLAWRIVGLVNVYRLLAAAVLLGVHLLTLPVPAFGASLPRLFVQICIAYFSVGALLAAAGRRYWPNRRVLVLAQTLVDTLAISGLLYASGGVASNLAVLLVLPVGGMALLADGADPLFVAALATLGVLLQQALAQLANLAPTSDYPLAGLAGAVIFAVALTAWPVANRLRESEALVRRQEVDLANLAELSQYIVQHLRESMLVVDTGDRIRLSMRPNRLGYLYVFNLGTSGQTTLLYPRGGEAARAGRAIGGERAEQVRARRLRVALRELDRLFGGRVDALGLALAHHHRHQRVVLRQGPQLEGAGSDRFAAHRRGIGRERDRGDEQQEQGRGALQKAFHDGGPHSDAGAGCRAGACDPVRDRGRHRGGVASRVWSVERKRGMV